MASNVRSPFADLDARLERQYGLPSGYLSRTAVIESSNNPSARNPNSSAGGRFQFIDSTARQYGLRDRFDPEQATDAAARLAQDNARYLRQELQRDPTAAELYLAHQQGAGGAVKMLRDPNANAAAVVGRDAIRLNAGNDRMTTREFADKWLNKFNAGGGGDTVQVANRGVTLNSVPALQPGSAAPALPPPVEVATLPQGYSAEAAAPAAPAQQQQPGIIETAKEKGVVAGLDQALGNKDFLSGIGQLANAFGGGGGGGQAQPQQAPVPMLPAEPDDTAQRVAAAQPLMMSLLQKRRGRVPGLSLMSRGGVV